MRVQQRRLVGAVYSEEIAVVVRGDTTTTMMRWTDGAYRQYSILRSRIDLPQYGKYLLSQQYHGSQ